MVEAGRGDPTQKSALIVDCCNAFRRIRVSLMIISVKSLAHYRYRINLFTIGGKLIILGFILYIGRLPVLLSIGRLTLECFIGLWIRLFFNLRQFHVYIIEAIIANIYYN